MPEVADTPLPVNMTRRWQPAAAASRRSRPSTARLRPGMQPELAAGHQLKDCAGQPATIKQMAAGTQQMALLGRSTECQLWCHERLCFDAAAVISRVNCQHTSWAPPGLWLLALPQNHHRPLHTYTCVARAWR